MYKLSFDFEGINEQQVSELISNLNSIEGFKAYPLKTEIQVKECLVVFFLEILKEVSLAVIVSVVASKILQFFEKEKSIDDQPITININNVQINQGESAQEIENKLIISIGKQK